MPARCASRATSDARNTLLAQNHGNHTNLAIKGIIAIQATSEISQIMSDETQGAQYQVSLLPWHYRSLSHILFISRPLPIS